MKAKLLINTILLCAGFNTTLHAQSYTLDPLHSYVAWQISHFDFSNPSGKWFATGTLNYDPNNLAASKVNATLKLADGVTGIPDLDKHLKGKLFFNVEQFPNATFVSDKIEIADKQIKKVHGQLTLHGVTKPITLLVKLNKIGNNPISDKPSIGFSATTQLKRSDFGITTMLPGIGDDVNLSIEIEASA
ncbi:YceI family protein [Candidatus Berkiella aquae]|uniref:YceI family protein n=1 Tax=Candidatus Berkiella aquae TaxID=295108 RepID=A0A0Q9YJV5_9GAMM|nr:YceI family protein [Candidatus Berkiella aquae]MCS5710096.1 YceI family protein [Candidatus Berkiella aquae]